MSRFTANQGGTVTDNQTGLTWTQATIAKDATHQAAEEAVTALGEGWRLPTVQELFSIVDHSREEPAIDVDVFPGTARDWYWSSSLTAWNDAAIWVVHFAYGGVRNTAHYSYGCVRAVRSGQQLFEFLRPTP